MAAYFREWYTHATMWCMQAIKHEELYVTVVRELE